MARSQQGTGSRRYFVTVSREEAERLEAYAVSVDRRPTTVAGELLLAGLDAATGQAGDDLSTARRRIEELEHQLAAVFAAHQPPERDSLAAPRWEWPIDELLADQAWWDRWLPRLYELVGRDANATSRLQGLATGRAVAADDRGYMDLLSHLFSPVSDAGRLISWRSIEYPSATMASLTRANEGTATSVRPHVWEPVLRHMAVALCALEECGQVGADAQLRLETEERLTGSWVRTLRNLVGEAPNEPLPQPLK